MHWWGWELILDNILSNFYHGLSSIYDLKGWPEAGMVVAFVGVLVGQGKLVPLGPFQLMHATKCEDSTIIHDLSPR